MNRTSEASSYFSYIAVSAGNVLLSFGRLQPSRAVEIIGTTARGALVATICGSLQFSAFPYHEKVSYPNMQIICVLMGIAGLRLIDEESSGTRILNRIMTVVLTLTNLAVPSWMMAAEKGP